MVTVSPARWLDSRWSKVASFRIAWYRRSPESFQEYELTLACKKASRFCPSLLSVQVRRISPCQRLAFTFFVSLTPIRIFHGSQTSSGSWQVKSGSGSRIRTLVMQSESFHYYWYSVTIHHQSSKCSFLIHTSRESRSRKPLACQAWHRICCRVWASGCRVFRRWCLFSLAHQYIQ